MYFDIAFFLRKHGNEGPRKLTKNSFDLKLTSEGKEYWELNYNESTKKSQGDDYNEMNEQATLLAQLGKCRCPVNSFKLYISKLTKLECFFQAPNPYYNKPSDCWYKASPVGKNMIGKFLKQICENSGLTRIYSNHCIRGTTATAMHKSGYSLHDIPQITKHKNLESLKCYLEKHTIEDMENYSDSLLMYVSKEDSKSHNNTHTDDEDF